jgi:glycosyltransferase involved in cell wall biosynthesis
MRILFFTHRFGKDIVGGPENHLWNLAVQMTRMGCQVDVATTYPCAVSPTGRFGGTWETLAAIPYEEIAVPDATTPICVHRFPVRTLGDPLEFFCHRLLERRWEREEAAMEPQLPLAAPFAQGAPLLLTGWHPLELSEAGQQVRWTTGRAALQLPAVKGATLHIEAFAPRRVTIAFDRMGISQEILHSGSGHFQARVQLADCPTETVAVLRVAPLTRAWTDPRSLGVRVSQVFVSQNGEVHMAPLHVDHRTLRARDKEAFIATYAQRAAARPGGYCWLHEQLQGPRCPGMEKFLRKNADRYDWVLAGVLPYTTLSRAAARRRKRNFRLATLPLFHVEDDAYYWRHNLEALRTADTNLANSTFAAETFFPAIGAQAFMAGAGVDEALFLAHTISGERFRRKFSLAPDEKIVLSVGRKNRAKLYRTLAKAVDQIQDRQKCRLVLVGLDEDHLAIGFPSCIYLGVLSQEDLLDAYDACDVFCMMSESESFGIAFAEAWMRRKPVIGNRNCAAVGSLIRPGENGLLAGTRQELQEGLLDLLTHPETGTAMGQAGQEMVLRKHTWRVIARRVLDHLEAVAGR